MSRAPRAPRPPHPVARAIIAAAALAAAATGCGSAAGGATPGATSSAFHSAAPVQMATGGTVHFALDMSDAAMVRLDPSTLNPFGIADDLERQLGIASGLATSTTRYASTALILAGLQRAEWDVAVLPADEARSAGAEVTGPLVEVEQTYLVPQGSAIHAVADVDQAGRRIAVETDSPADIALRGTLKNATMVHADTDAATLDLLASGAAGAMAGSRAALTILSARVPGSHVLTDTFATAAYGLAAPGGRAAAGGYLTAFGAASRGVVSASIRRDALRGMTVP